MNNDTKETKRNVSIKNEKRTTVNSSKRAYNRKTNYTNKKRAESSDRNLKNKLDTTKETSTSKGNSENIQDNRKTQRNKKVKSETKPRNMKRRNNPILDFEFKKSNLKIIALGGLDEIGKNITIFEYEDDIILVDCGLEFPEDDMLGVDLVIPDFTYLIKNESKIKGLFVTYGHEDHIGSIPYLIKQLSMPIQIYATKLTAKLIQHKLEEHRLLNSTQLNIVDPGDKIDAGKMSVEFIRSSHSIPDSCMLAISTPVGNIIHTGDFKVDYTPIDGQVMDFGRLAELGSEGVLALLADSTNSERKGFTMSEKSIGPVFDKLFEGCKKRIVVATFASNVHRVQQIVNSAIKYDRKIAVSGRSMENMIDAARELGYIDAPDDIFISIDMINNYTDEQLVIITTGSQGETMSALTRMANGEHRKVTITGNDLVIISATPIPGNEKSVSKVINQLMKIGAEVVYSALEDIHVSGHACQEEQKLIMALTKPKFFLPVHGEYRQLMAHKETAISMGIPKDNIYITANGRVLEMNEQKAEFTGKVRFHNLTKDELGLLLWSLKLEDSSWMNIGMAKAWGYGAVKVQIISAKCVDVDKAYDTTQLSLGVLQTESLNIDEYIEYYKKHFEETNHIKLDAQESVKDFLLMKDSNRIPDYKNIRYMSLEKDKKEYQSRKKPLPTVQEVLELKKG